MSSSVLVLGDLKGGRLRLDNLIVLNQWIQAQPDGARFRAVFEVTDHSKRGRLERFYRYVLLPHAAETFGNDRPEMHRVFYGLITGEWLAAENPILRAAMSQMSDHNLSCFVQDAVRIAAEQGCVLAERP